MRQCTTAQKHAIRSDEAVITDRNWSGRLATAFQVNAVCQNLGSIARKRAKCSDSDRARAVDEMTIRDGGVLTYDELRPPIDLVRKMTGLASWIPGYPISSTDNSILLQMQQL